MKRENLPWFLSSAALVAISQAFVYASLAVAPLIVVTPILQLSLVFRLMLSQWINRDHEVMNTAVIIGALAAVLGSILIALDTDELMGFRICRRDSRTSWAIDWRVDDQLPLADSVKQVRSPGRGCRAASALAAQRVLRLPVTLAEDRCG
jgi:hypothetical protein